VRKQAGALFEHALRSAWCQEGRIA
jgi:hypothetical protein